MIPRASRTRSCRWCRFVGCFLPTSFGNDLLRGCGFFVNLEKWFRGFCFFDYGAGRAKEGNWDFGICC